MQRLGSLRFVFLVLCVGLGGILAGCGDDGGSGGGEASPPGVGGGPAAPEVRDREPDGPRLVFSLDVEAAIRAERVSADVDREQLVRDSMAVVHDRLETYGLVGCVVQPVGAAGFEVVLPADSQAELDHVVGLVTRRGELTFRIHVLPGPNQHEQRKRTSVWPDTPEAFHAWKAKELERYRIQMRKHGPYRPVDPTQDAGARPFFLVKRQGREGSTVDDFEVCEIPEAGSRFDGRILTDPRVGQDPQTGRPVIYFGIKSAYQNAFAQWTERNVGLPMAIIVNDEFTGEGRAPTIQSKLTDSVQITLGAMSAAEAEREAKELVTVLQAGVLRVPARLVSIERPVGAAPR